MNIPNHLQKPEDSVWLWTIFACAMGAGVLYLPINAGINGIWPILTIALIIVPMVYLSHKNLSKVVLAASSNTTNINDIISEHYSERFANLFALCYFLAIYPLMLIYSVGLTNTSHSILKSILHINYIPKSILALVILLTLLTVALTKSSFIRKITEYIALPLAAALFLISCYLIPKWNYSYLTDTPSAFDFIETMWLTLPVVIFSFNFSPIVSTFTLNYLEKHDSPDTATEKVLLRSTLVLFIFIMFFIVSCVLSVNQEQMYEAKNNNMNILVYMGELFDDPILHIVSPLIALVAMTGAFLGTFFGAKESVIGLIEQKMHIHKIRSQRLNKIATALIFIPSYIFCILDTNILNIISILCGPVIALLLFIFPVYAIYTISKLAEYKQTKMQRLGHYFIVTTGIVSFSAILYSFKYLLLFLK